MASLATIPTMFLGADVLGMPPIVLARYFKAPTSVHTATKHPYTAFRLGRLREG